MPCWPWPLVLRRPRKPCCALVLWIEACNQLTSSKDTKVTLVCSKSFDQH